MLRQLLTKILALAILNLTLLGIVACDKTENPVLTSNLETKPKNQEWQIGIVNESPIAIFEDGVTVEGWETYQKELTQHLNIGAFEDAGLTLVISELEKAPIGQFQGDIKFPVGKYFVRFSAETGFIGGCIGKRVPHLGIMVSPQGEKKPLVNIHFAGWSENGKPCFGIYNSGSQKPFCWRGCGPRYQDIVNALTSALVAAGLTYATAQIVAAAIAPVAMALVVI